MCHVCVRVDGVRVCVLVVLVFMGLCGVSMFSNNNLMIVRVSHVL